MLIVSRPRCPHRRRKSRLTGSWGFQEEPCRFWLREQRNCGPPCHLSPPLVHLDRAFRTDRSQNLPGTKLLVSSPQPGCRIARTISFCASPHMRAIPLPILGYFFRCRRLRTRCSIRWLSASNWCASCERKRYCAKTPNIALLPSRCISASSPACFKRACRPPIAAEKAACKSL